tara:strand:+ start:52 stop:288 length:237 start_codon:yes stop_codon:yes gene_type:complete
MKAEILKVIGQLQYEISILDIDEERLTGVDIRTEELKELVKKLTIPVVSNSVVCSHESYAYTLNNDAKICDDCDAIFE